MRKNEARLKTTGISSARLDTLIMLEDELKIDRSHLLAHPETTLQGVALKRLEKKLNRRLKHEPLAYIRGFSEFYGRRFKVNRHVLEPRPESETMIELLKELATSNKQQVTKRWKIADVGTGCGALAVTAKLEIPESKVIATDIDLNCLRVARQNAEQLNADIKFFQGDLLRPLLANGYQLSAIMANLPYVPNGWKINKAAAMEPRVAIFGGSDGLDVYRRFFEQLTHFSWQPKYIFTESLPPQHAKLNQIAQSAGFKELKTQDFIQVFSGG